MGMLFPYSEAELLSSPMMESEDEVLHPHLNALSTASNCVRSDLSCGVTGGILRLISSNS